METRTNWLLILLPFAGLVSLWLVTNAREKQVAKKVYQAVDEGRLSDVKSMLSKHAFPNQRTVVVATSIVRAVQSRQPAILDFLLSKELKPISLTQKLDSFLHEQSLRGGWRGVVLWQSRTSHMFEPWRDLSKSDKLKLRSRASRGDTVETAKAHLRGERGRWTVP
ncbi:MULTISPECIES: hypothetical protein [unclassified Myxococcus]|uniref:hypothetical protein n=1 Tax=unclassified Myxococcus TaxID=2648731 RepID=UPI0020C6B446|nr:MULTISPECIES: hypothetical protein [unclassified Myxococcus]